MDQNSMDCGRNLESSTIIALFHRLSRGNKSILKFTHIFSPVCQFSPTSQLFPSHHNYQLWRVKAFQTDAHAVCQGTALFRIHWAFRCPWLASDTVTDIADSNAIHSTQQAWPKLLSWLPAMNGCGIVGICTHDLLKIRQMHFWSLRKQIFDARFCWSFHCQLTHTITKYLR